MSLLQVKNLSVSFESELGRLQAVDNISFSLERNEVLGVVGESGSSKSVTALSIMNMIAKPNRRIDNGEVTFRGKNLLSLTEKEWYRIRGNKIAIIFQEPMNSLNPVFTIHRQLMEVYKIHSPGISKNEFMNKIIDILDWLKFKDIHTVLKKYPFELSGGMCQRIMIAMAMLSEPSILIADEPTTALDVSTQAEILRLFKETIHKTDCAMMMITHDLGVIAELADQVAVMYHGSILEKCNVFKFFDSPMHPYSQGLINALPSNFDGRFKAISGSIPKLYGKIKGCCFASHCSHAMVKCQLEPPGLTEVRENHFSACWLVHKDVRFL